MFIMGLVFPIQPDLKNSKLHEHLVIRTTKSRFSLGFGFLVGGCLLGTMYLAASPLFKLLWNEGQFFDQFVTLFIIGLMILYPFAALVSWFFEEVVEIQKSAQSATFKMKKYSKIFGFEFFKTENSDLSFDSLSIQNWKAAINMAALAEKSTGKKDRYSTQGHWILKWNNKAIERRAKKDDILELYLKICAFFKKEPLFHS
jgi:hypothetical protein